MGHDARDRNRFGAGELGDAMNRPSKWIADDDPRRCPVAGVGMFHDFEDPQADGRIVLRATCQHCGVPVHKLLDKVCEYLDSAQAHEAWFR